MVLSPGLAPFVSFGVHGAQNDLVKEIGFMDDEVLIGTHGGLGFDIRLGPLSVTLEGRYGSYIRSRVLPATGSCRCECTLLVW